MSLELAMNRNSDLLEKLIAVLQSTGVPAGAPAEQPAATRKPRAAKGEATAGQETSAGQGADTSPAAASPAPGPFRLLPGAAEGTRYFHVAAHNTVFEVLPGSPMPLLSGMVEVHGDEYASLKAGYAAQFPTSAAGAQTASPAASPAAATPSASPASATQPAASAAAAKVDGPAIVQKCKDLHAKHGNDGLKKVLEQFKVGKVGELAAKTEVLEAAAKFIDGLLNPQAAAEPAGADLF